MTTPKSDIATMDKTTKKTKTSTWTKTKVKNPKGKKATPTNSYKAFTHKPNSNNTT